MAKPTYLTEWDFFVWRHRGTGNLAMHFISFWMFFIALYITAISGNLWLLLFVPLSQLTGFLGHYFFEEGGVRSRDFFHPRTLWFLVRIFSLCISGKYSREMRRVRNVVAANNNGRAECSELTGQLFYGR